MYSASMERSIILIFIAGRKYMNLSKVSFSIMISIARKIASSLSQPVLRFSEGVPAWLREGSTSESGSFTFRRFEPWRELKLMDLVRFAKASRNPVKSVTGLVREEVMRGVRRRGGRLKGKMHVIYQAILFEVSRIGLREKLPRRYFTGNLSPTFFSFWPRLITGNLPVKYIDHVCQERGR